jgi:hypothetical protein
MGDMGAMDLFSEILMTKESPDLPTFIKWKDTVIGRVNPDRSVNFTLPNLNLSTTLITEGKNVWFPEEYKTFLEERIPSRSRKDIEKILRKCGQVEYDVFRLAAATILTVY